MTPPLFLVQNQAQDIETKLGEFKTHRPEFLLSLVPQHMTPCRPERRNGPPNRRVPRFRVSVDVTGICDFSPGGAIYAMDLAMSQLLQILKAQFLG